LLTQAFNKVLINDKEVRIKGIIPDGLQNTFLGTHRINPAKFEYELVGQIK
jgi:hypothetical protein